MARKVRRRTHGSGSLIKRGHKWYIRYYENGERREDATGLEDRESAEQRLAIRLGEVAAGVRLKEQPRTATVQDALQLVIDDYIAKEHASIRDCRGRVDLHLTPAIGHLLLTSLSASDIRKYVKLRRNEEAAPASINRELAVLRRALKLSQQESPPWIDSAPTVEMLDEDNVRQGYVEHSQYELLLKKLAPHAQLPLVIGFHTGIRRGTILSIRLDQVDWPNQLIRLTERQVKNRSAHVIPIYGDMGPFIEMALAGNVKYLCEEKGERIRTLRKPWDDAVKAAKFPELLFHDLRRSAVRNMIRAGIPEKTAMFIAGMKTRSIIDRYNIIAENDVVTSSVRLAAYLAEKQLGEGLGEAEVISGNGPVN